MKTLRRLEQALWDLEHPEEIEKNRRWNIRRSKPFESIPVRADGLNRNERRRLAKKGLL